MRRTLLLLAAVLIAAIGTALVYTYVRAADNRAAAGVEEVPVLVAAQDESVGTAAASIRTTRVRVVRKDLVPGALDSMEGVSGRLAVGLLAGQQISSNAFVQGTGSSGSPGTATVAVTIPVANQAGGTVQAGDRVDVYEIVNGRSTRVLSGLEVLSIGVAPVSPTTVLFTVPSAQVEALLNAQAAGTLILVKPSG